MIVPQELDVNESIAIVTALKLREILTTIDTDSPESKQTHHN